MKTMFYRLLLASIFSLVLTSPSEAATTTKSKTTNVSIPDNGGWVYSAIPISDAPAGATVTSVQVYFRCVHAYSGDLQVDLEIETYSNSKRLWDNEGAGADNPSRTTTTSNFNGLPVNKTWYLYARDTSALDAGYIDEWTITITYTTPNPQSDIVVQGTPSISPNPVTAGSSVTVSYTIKNQGARSAGSSETKIQIKNSSGTQITAPTFSEGSLSAGASASRSRSVTIPSGSAAGTYTAFVILDNDSELDQSNTSNDFTPGVNFTVSTPVQQSDIVVQGTPSISPNPVTAGNSITVDYTITNQGSGSASASETKIQIKNSSGTQITAPTFSEGSLSAGASASRSRSVTIPGGYAAGTYTAFVILDNQSELDQSNTSNDFTPGVNFTVSAAQPDLTVENVSFTPSSVSQGGSFTISYTIRNIGNATAGATFSRMRLSTDSTLTLADPGLSPLDEQIPSLAAGATHDVSRNVTVPGSLAAGQYYVGVFADAGFDVDQPQGNDAGLSAGRITVVSMPLEKPDLQFEGFPAINPATAEPSATVSVSYTIRNSGNANAGTTETKIQIKNVSGVEVASQTYSEPPLSAGGSANRSRSFTLPALSNGGYVAYVILDNQSNLDQQSTGNDYSPGIAFQIEAGGAPIQTCNLRFSGSISVTPDPVDAGQTLTVQYSVQNTGPANAPQSTTKIVIHNASGNEVATGYQSLVNIDAGDTHNGQVFSIAIPASAAGGSYYAKLYLDNYDQLNQSSVTDDYSARVYFSVTRDTPSQPDVGSRALGIDLSHNNPPLSQAQWHELYSLGIRFAYIKGTDGEVLGPNNVNTHRPYFLEQAARAKAAGVAVGAYYFSYPYTVDPSQADDPDVAAANFVSSVGAYIGPGFLPPALDIEATDYGNPANMDTGHLAEWITRWADKVKEMTGVDPILYLNGSFAQSNILPEIKSKYDLWVADWDSSRDTMYPEDRTLSARGWGDWKVHQYQGCPYDLNCDYKLPISGYGLFIDLNHLNGRLADFVVPMPTLTIRQVDAAAATASSSVALKTNMSSAPTTTIRLVVEGLDKERVLIQNSNDLVHWTDLIELELINGVAIFDDTVTDGASRRFYRASE